MYTYATTMGLPVYVYTDMCVYSLNKWPLDSTNETNIFLFVAQFSGINISSGVLVTSNSVIVSASLSESFMKRMRRNGERDDVRAVRACLPLIQLLSLILS